MPDVFLSYSREDQAVARRFAQALERAGFRVWWDQTLSAGEAYDEVTEAALEKARAVVVLWSKNSVASRWVRAEATIADRLGTLVPVMIETCKRPIMFELRQTAELSGWAGDADDPAWCTFVSDLKRKLPIAESATGIPAVAQASPVAETRSRAGRPVRILAAAIVGVAALLASAAWFWHRASETRQARAAVSEISVLVDAGNYPAAFARAQEIRRIIPDDSLLKSLTPLFTTVYSITSTPAGAEVFVRGYDDAGGQWQSLGRAPLERVELPRRALRWKFEKAGMRTVERANSALGFGSAMGGYLGNEAGQLEITLRPDGEQPPGMVYVPGGATAVGASQLPATEVPPFLIDRTEVTNAAYKEFVDAGGYERRSWWEVEITKGGRPLSFEQAMLLFVDATGRPGPASWELGSFPEGKGENPVSGISWYEAAAYARFRGKSLPTPFHWAKAAFLSDEVASSLAASAAPLSNFGTSAVVPVATSGGVGPYGTYDLFGNVREWVLNHGPGGGGWVIGGSWEDPWYSYATVAPEALLERSRLNGFRLVQNLSEPANGPALRAVLDLTRQDRVLPSLKPVSDEAFATLQGQLSYGTGALNASAPVTMATTEDWIKQRVTIDTGYNNERMDVILFMPTRARPPFQPVIFFSGIQIFRFPATVESIEPGFSAMPLDYIVKSGRMLVQPVFQGSFERFKSRLDLNDEVRLSNDMIQWRYDLGRTLDYLATRPDVDATRTGYVGVSFGASVTVPLLAVEPRLRAIVLMSGGLLRAHTPLLDAVNYGPRIKVPVLMVNGRFDEVFPIESAQLPLFRLIGSPPGNKRHVILNSGHGSPPRNEALKETLGWYDKYLGEVGR